MMALFAIMSIAMTSVDSVTFCVVDAVTSAPLVGAHVTRPAAARSDVPSMASTRRLESSCTRDVPGDIEVRRVGYRLAHVVLEPAAATRLVAMQPLAAPPPSASPRADTVQVLAMRRVEASAAGASGAASMGRVSRSGASTSVDAAREAGAATTTQVLERLPYAQVRSARGETGVSLRGARREQMVITLDGLALNDPATGVADVSEVPLAALDDATVVLGADPLGTGPGATGGVVALTSATRTMLALRTGSLGQRSAEAAWAWPMTRAVWHASAMHRRALNDFAFENAAGATGAPVRERRVNNDQRLTSATLGAIGDRWQVLALASHQERGMVGPANVRTYDADRARTDRVMARAQVDGREVQLQVGVRHLTLAYQDPTRPDVDSRARVWSSDAEARGRQTTQRSLVPSAGWRVGAGHDDLQASGGVAQRRARGFAMTQGTWQGGVYRADLGARVDVVEATALQPSFSLAIERELRHDWRLSARAAQAVRVPTLYDLYFASPQRLRVRTLRPERVSADLEIATRWTRQASHGAWSLDGALVSRTTRDAIVWFPGNFGWSPANVGIERMRGGEARARFAASWGDVSAWSTYYDAVLNSGALTIPTPYVARAAGGLQALVRADGLSATLTMRSTGRRPFSAGPRDRAFELPAVTQFDLAVSHGLPRRVLPSRTIAMITWSLENATDVAWQSVRGFPSAGRTWSVSVTLRHTPPS
jgi:outer membrane cobalamin receptor